MKWRRLLILQKKNLKCYKQLQQQIDAHKTKASLNHLRRELLEQKNIYQTEYDRIRRMLDDSVTKNHKPLQERKRKWND